MGVFETPPFDRGTVAVAKAVADPGATSVVGGGDSEKAVKSAGVSERSHMCPPGAALRWNSFGSRVARGRRAARPMKKTSLAKNKIKILLLEGIHSSAVEAFRRDGYTEIEYHQKSLPEPQLIASLRNAYLVGIRSATQLPARVFEQAPKLIGVGCFVSEPTKWIWTRRRKQRDSGFQTPPSRTREV